MVLLVSTIYILLHEKLFSIQQNEFVVWSHTDCFMPDPLVRQSSVELFINTKCCWINMFSLSNVVSQCCPAAWVTTSSIMMIAAVSTFVLFQCQQWPLHYSIYTQQTSQHSLSLSHSGSAFKDQVWLESHQFSNIQPALLKILKINLHQSKFLQIKFKSSIRVSGGEEERRGCCIKVDNQFCIISAFWLWFQHHPPRSTISFSCSPHLRR